MTPSGQSDGVLQRYVEAQLHVWETSEAHSEAFRAMQSQRKDARLALPVMRERVDVEVNGKTYCVFKDEAGIIVVPPEFRR